MIASRAFLVTIALVELWHKPSVTDFTTKAFITDRFGELTSYLHYGSKITIWCDCMVCSSTKGLQLHLDNQMLPISATIVKETFRFNLTLDEKFVLGQYACAEVTGNFKKDFKPIVFSHYLCDDESSSCQVGDSCPTDQSNRFCIFDKNNSKNCATLQKSTCFLVPGTYACDITFQPHASHCHASLSNTPVLSSVTNERDCYSRGSEINSFVNALTKKDLLARTSLFNIDHPVKIKVRTQYRSDLFEKTIDGRDLWSTIDTGRDLDVPLSKYTGRNRVYGLTRLFLKSNGSTNSFINLISLPTPVVKLIVPPTQCSSGTQPKEAVCNFTNSASLPSGHFTISMILKAGSLVLNANHGKLSITTNKFPVAGTYTCTAKVRFRSCSPFTERTTEGNDSALVASCAQSAIVTPSPDSSHKGIIDYVVAVVVVVVAIVIVLCIIGAVWILKRWKASRRNAALEKTLDPRVVDPKNILNMEKLQKLTAFLVNPKMNYDAARQYVKEKLGTKAQDDELMKQGLAASVPNCRWQDIPCLKVSQIGDQHVNRLFDWYDDSLYIAMAPVPSQFVAFWQMILMEKIGIVVWVGELEENSGTRIDPYISLKVGSKTFIDRKLKQSVRIYTKAVKDVPENKYTGYIVELTASTSNKVKTENLTFIHVREWPDHSIPRPQHCARLHYICDVIEKLHKAARKRSPGVLFHCSAGVQRSVALIALYIGRQIYMERRKVNVLGIIQLIREHRFGAFLYVRTGYMQVPIIVGCLAALAQSMDEETLAAVRPFDLSPNQNKLFGGMDGKKSSVAMSYKQSKKSSIIGATP